jgi:hypothetical protein
MVTKFTGGMLFNVFRGEENRQPMTRAIARIGAREYAVYLNETEGGVIAAVHTVTGRNGNSPIIDKNALAMAVCDSVEGIDEIEYIVPELEFDGVMIRDYAICAVRTNKNDNEYRQAMPLAIAKVRYGATEKKAPAATGTDDNAL